MKVNNSAGPEADNVAVSACVRHGLDARHIHINMVNRNEAGDVAAPALEKRMAPLPSNGLCCLKKRDPV